MTQAPPIPDAADAHGERLTQPALAELVRRFYAAARLDPVLGPVFESAVGDWESHLARVTAFWTSVLLGVRAYRGDPLGAHRRRPLTPEMFERWLAIWGNAAGEMFEPETARLLGARAAMIAESLQLGLFGMGGPAPGATRAGER